MTPTSLISWPQNKPYWAQFAVTGYTGSISWSRSGSLPPGLTFDAVNGRLTGLPSTVGSYTFNVTATGTGLTQTKAYTLAITNPPSLPATSSTLVKWTWDADTSANTFASLPSSDVQSALAEVTYGYQGGSNLTGGLFTGGTSATSSVPLNASGDSLLSMLGLGAVSDLLSLGSSSSGGGQVRSFSGWESSKSYATSRNSLLHLNTGSAARFSVYPSSNTSSIPTSSQTSNGETGVFQTRLKFNPNAIGDLKAFYFDALRWQSGRMDVSGTNGPRWAELHAYWLNDSAVLQRWDSSTVDINAIYRPEHRGTNQFSRFWFDLDAGSSGLNQRIKSTIQKFRSNRQVFFDLYLYYDAGTDLTGMTGSNPPAILFDEVGVMGNMTSTVPTVSLGNMVFNDMNFNGKCDAGEGVAGVSVQLQNLAGTVLKSTTTGLDGSYLFTGLAEGSYAVKIPASEFAAGKPLFGLVSMTGSGGDNGIDDHVDENGLDDSSPATNGIKSGTIALRAQSEPINEAGLDGAMDDSSDDQGDMTVDFGFQFKPAFAIGDRVYRDGNSNGTCDPGEGVDGVSVELLSSSNTVISTQTTANGGRYLFPGLSTSTGYYVRAAASNFTGAGALVGHVSVAGNGSDNGVDNDDNGVDDTAASLNGLKSGLITPRSNMGGVFTHTWPASATALVGQAGGTWDQILVRHSYPASLLDVSVTLDTATQSTQALWMVISNGTSVSSPNSNLAAIYLANGQVRVTPYSAAGTTTHGLATVIYSTTYTTVNVGTKRTFRFALDTNAINAWAGRPAGWQGIGFPYDAQGAKADVNANKISLRLRSFADGAATLSGNIWTVTYGTSSDTNVGSFDDVTAVSNPGAEMAVDLGFFVPPASDSGDFAGFGSASSFSNSSLRIGALVDGEITNLANNSALGDDTTGVDDEDGVTMPASMQEGTADSVTVNVTNTTGSAAYLNGWIDFNNNGTLTDSGEQIASNISIPTGTASLNKVVIVNVPESAITGEVGVRFRLSSTSNPGTTGAAGSGEIEDHKLTITTANTPSTVLYVSTIDKSNKGWLESYDIATGVKKVIGATTDSSSSGSGSARNHVFFDIAWSPTGNLYGIEPSGSNTKVYQINPSTGATTFRGQIANKFNGMVFDKTGKPYVSSFNLSDVYTFSMNSLEGGGDTISVTKVYDAPSNTPDGGLLQSAGDVAWVGSELFYATVSSSSSRYYLYKGPAGGGAMTLVGEFKNTSGSAIAGVYGLIGDGFGSLYAQAGSSLYKLNRATATAESFAATITSNEIYGGAIPSESSQVNDDYSDNSGIGVARNAVNDKLRLGALIDGEAPTFNAGATGDDSTGVDDEDGVTFDSFKQGEATTLTIRATNATTAAAYLNAWIDFNGNGLLTDAGEKIVTNVSVTAGANNAAQTFTISVPLAATVGNVGLRVRLTTNSGAGPTGVSNDGEIEDYMVTIAAGVIPCGTLAISPSSLEPATAGRSYSQTNPFSASAGTAPYTYAASGVPAGMTFNAGTQLLTGNPTTLGTFNITITATDARNCTGSTVVPLSVVCPAVIVNSASLPNGVVGSAYAQSVPFSAMGGTSPYTYTAGGVPAGLSFDAANKKLVGTPTTPGTASVTITATDALGCVGNVSVPLTINAATSLGVGSLVWEDFNNDGVKQAGESGLANASVRLYRSGADNTINTADDSLISGPIATSSAGEYSFGGLSAGNYYVSVTPPSNGYRTSGTPVTSDNRIDNDNNGNQPGGVGTVCYSPIINLAAGAEPTSEDGNSNTDLTVDFGLWAGFTIGDSVWHDVNNNGVRNEGESAIEGVTVQLLTPGSDGVAGGMDDSVISSTTTNATGNYSFKVHQTGNFYIRVNPIQGYEVASSIAFGDNGVDGDNNGTQTGAPGSSVNSPVFTLQAVKEPGTGGSTNTEATMDFGLWEGMSLSGYVWEDANNNGISDPEGGPFADPELGIQSQTLGLYSAGADRAIGGSGSNADVLVSTTTSQANGAFSFTKLKPGFYFIRISPGATYPLASAVVDLDDNGQLYDNNGAQPGGIGMEISSRVVELQPLSEPGLAGTTNIENSLWFGMRKKPVIVINPELLPGGQISLPYTQTVSAEGGTEPYTWSVSSGTLPVGLSLNSTTGEISGTPTVAGTSYFTIQARDAQQVTGSRDYSLKIHEVVISPPTLPIAYKGESFSQVLVASGGSEPYTWSIISGSLPPGLSLSSVSGQIAGTPDTTGTFTFTVKVIDINGFYGTKAYTLTVLGTVSLGNLIFEDQDGDNLYSPGEGIDGITVQLYLSSQTPGTDVPVASLVTANGGKYIFTDLSPGQYVVHVPASQFGTTGLLRGLFSLPGVQEGDDDAGEDGVDTNSPQLYGVSSTVVNLQVADLPTDATGETGFDHISDNASQAGDAGVDLTVDLGFFRRVAVGNLVFMDGNGNGRADNGEGIAGVTVQIYRAAQIPGTDTPVASTTTNSGGRYMLTDLQPGLYRLHIPSSMFQPGAPLEAKISIAQGQWGDDDVGEDGLNTTNPITQGVSSNEVYLLAGLAPTSSNGETGIDSATDDEIDSAVNLTIDFGFQSPAIIGNLVFKDLNNNGRYDQGEGVDGVTLDVYANGSIPGVTQPLGTVVTADGGHYLFGNLASGTYFVNVRASNFSLGGPLYGQVSMVGTGTINSDDSQGEDGLDNGSPNTTGVNSAEILVRAGSMPLDSASGSITGENGFQSDDDNGNGQDANGNMTIDFGFVPMDETKVGIGNLVFNDADGDGRFDEGEGVDGVLVELYHSQQQTLASSTYTSNGGQYFFSNLVPGTYFVSVAATNFQGAGKLVGRAPMAGQGMDDGMDDDADENGDDPAEPAASGVRSVDIELVTGGEPTDLDTELGGATFLDGALDTNCDLTVDFGFYTLGGLGNLVFIDANKNGKADAGEGVGGVTVKLFRAGEDPNADEPVATVVTDRTAGHTGSYLFSNIAPGDYYVHIPREMFAQGGPLVGRVSMTGVESGQKDDNAGENGVDPSNLLEQGVSSAVTQLRPGSEPFGTQESGLYGGDDASAVDKNYDLTIDFGFVTQPAVGNLVFRDVNGDGRYTGGVDSGIDNVTVEIYSGGATPQLKSSVVTSGGGKYLLSVPDGTYFIKIPNSMFGASGPLANTQATTAGTGDDHLGQDAIDHLQREIDGVRTAEFTLALGGMPTAASGELGFDSAADDGSDANVNLAIDLGFRPLALGVGNLVFRDANSNGRFDTGDTGIPGVAMKLFYFGSDPRTATPVATAFTDVNGFYRLNAYAEDNYFVCVGAENFAQGGVLAGMLSSSGNASGTGDDNANENGIDAATPTSTGISSGLISLIYNLMPVDSSTETGAGASSDNDADSNANLTVDFGFRSSAGSPLAGRVRRDINHDGETTTDDVPLQSVEVALYSDDNADGKLDESEMTALDTAVSDSSGAYEFGDVQAGTYLVVAAPLPGATAEKDSDGGDPEQTKVLVAAAPITGIDFLQSLLPDTFAQWQEANELGGENGATDDPDGDGHNNLLEYALGTNPGTGVIVTPPFALKAERDVSAIVRKPHAEHADVRYSLEGSVNGITWAPLTISAQAEVNDDIETLTFSGIARQPMFANQVTGQLRLKVLLDADQNGTPEATATSTPNAYHRRTFAVGQTTFSMPLLMPEVFAGKGTVVDTRTVSIFGGEGLKSALSSTTSYVVEVSLGGNLLHSGILNVSASSDSKVVLEADLPAGLSEADVVIRPVQTLAKVLAPAAFHGANSGAVADRVMFFENGGYRIHWLFAAKGSPRWINDATVADTGAKAISPLDGMIVQVRQTPATVTLVGQVPQMKAKIEVKLGTRLQGGGSHLPVTPAGVIGDRVRVWSGDQTPGTAAFIEYSCTAAGWVDTATSLPAKDSLLLPFHAVFLQRP